MYQTELLPYRPRRLDWLMAFPSASTRLVISLLWRSLDISVTIHRLPLPSNSRLSGLAKPAPPSAGSPPRAMLSHWKIMDAGSASTSFTIQPYSHWGSPLGAWNTSLLGLPSLPLGE